MMAKQSTKVRHIPKVERKRTRMTSMRCGGSGRRRQREKVGLCFPVEVRQQRLRHREDTVPVAEDENEGNEWLWLCSQDDDKVEDGHRWCGGGDADAFEENIGFAEEGKGGGGDSEAEDLKIFLDWRLLRSVQLSVSPCPRSQSTWFMADKSWDSKEMKRTGKQLFNHLDTYCLLAYWLGTWRQHTWPEQTRALGDDCTVDDETIARYWENSCGWNEEHVMSAEWDHRRGNDDESLRMQPTDWRWGCGGGDQETNIDDWQRRVRGSVFIACRGVWPR